MVEHSMSTIQIGGLTMRFREDLWEREIIEAGEMTRDHYVLPEKLDTLIDIGAHIGGTSILAASLGAQVFSYEPSEDNFALLCENIRLNGFEHKITPRCLAVSSEEGIAILEKNNHNSGGYGFYSGGEEKVEVQTITLDQALAPFDKVDVLKIDCEGAEYDFLLNCNPELFAKIKQISMELHFVDERHRSPRLAAKFGERYSQQMISFLERFFKVVVVPSPAASARMVICRK